MNRLFDRLNLQPQERRLVVLVGTMVFVLLNIWFVWPHFTEWQRIREEWGTAQNRFERYQRQTNEIPRLKRELGELQSVGSEVLSDRQSIDMRRTVETLAEEHGVRLQRVGRAQPSRSGGGETNQFYQELTLSIQARADEPELVDFLYGLGIDRSMIRVKDLILSPHNQTNLLANMTLVASYQKNEIDEDRTTQTAKATQ